jgi:hypothetical protein
MRTTPVGLWGEEALEFDGLVHKTAESILGFPMQGDTWLQACLTPKFGGLGLRRVADHARAAYAASWHQSQATAGESWSMPRSVVKFEHTTQKAASFKIDQDIYEGLVERAASDRDKQRLRRIAEPHAGAFITAVPCADDGLDTVMKPQAFRTAVAYRLGVAVVPKGTPCPMCKQIMDELGDHAACCTRNGGNIVRHNRVRNLVNHYCVEAMLSPIMEKQGILGPTTGRRPGDVTIPSWSGGDGLAIDVAITSPFSRQHQAT